MVGRHLGQIRFLQSGEVREENQFFASGVLQVVREVVDAEDE
jgi:hypothetical protein